MPAEETLVLFEHRDVPDIDEIDVYEKHGGYETMKKAFQMERQAIVDEMKTAGVRGRGGAGFPTWIKWNGLPKEKTRPHYVLINADEGEPGTFKDRELMMKLPHLILEGVLIACRAVQADTAYIYIRGEFVYPALQVEKAVRQARERGYIGKDVLGTGQDIEVVVHTGAGSYECGEESALMNSLEGERGQPRLKPPSAPLPTVAGLWKSPTLINNVETYCCAVPVIARGGEWYASLGTERSKGTKIISVSGHVRRPGNYEIELGKVTIREMIELAGGPVGEVKAVIPGGSSVPIVRPDALDTPMDYEQLAAAGTMLGSGGFMVCNQTVDIVRLMWRTSHFYANESCGKCTPCREGTRWMSKIYDRIIDGQGRPEDIDLLLDICDQMDGRSFCGLGDAAAWPVRASIQRFREEYEHWVTERAAPAIPLVPR